ncbi:hypothetical protein MET9862_05652 [Methylobacterium symbioticum]|uniref:Uncharacterized protein n=1 Tax=Methylobacterium symbioticum TaxID=2584084 RepID=A0A509ENR7_9HYPH|nr:hypothetical protein MET9862_05652 [Methylobacterium symbioticum]
MLAIREAQALAQALGILRHQHGEGAERQEAGAGEPADLADAARDPGEQPGLAEGRDHRHGARRLQQLQELGPHPLAREPVEGLARRDAGGERRAVRRALPEPGVEAEETQDAQGVLADAGRRIPDEADAARREIRHAPGGVVQVSGRVEGERVHGEVAPLGVAREIGPETHHRAAPVRLHVLAQGRDLDGRPVRDQGHGAVLDPGRHRLESGGPGPRHHRLGQERRGAVDVGGVVAEQRVAHAAADEPGLGAGGGEGREHGRDAGPPAQALQPGGIERAHQRNCPGTRRPFSICEGT